MWRVGGWFGVACVVCVVGYEDSKKVLMGVACGVVFCGCLRGIIGVSLGCFGWGWVARGLLLSCS